MLLAIDVGNTQTHVGAFEGEALQQSWRFQTRAGATGDELAERLSGLLKLRGIGFDDLGGLVVSSVVPPLGTEYERLAEQYMDLGCLIVGPGIRSGMAIEIDSPAEVGADRLVNAIAAYDTVGDVCVGVDFGTGINFDAVSADGAYLGGAIAPGSRSRSRPLLSGPRGSHGSTSSSQNQQSAPAPERRFRRGCSLALPVSSTA